MNFLAYFTWDPSRVCFTVPYLNFTIAWYGVFFAFGFFVAYCITVKILRAHLYDESKSPEENQKQITTLFDRGAFIIILASVVGARVGYILFYGWHYYRANPEAIFNIREGGLASHGGVIGLLLALGLVTLMYRRKMKGITFLVILDCLVIPGAFAGAMIRVGNFFNQEITGTPTTLPWGVNFLHSMDGVGGVVHPVQLYEALFYLLLFFVMLMLWWARGKRLGEGFLSGVFFTLFFAFRFFVEFLKVPQGDVASSSWPLKMGQLLSLPFFFIGIFFLIRYYRKGEKLSDLQV